MSHIQLTPIRETPFELKCPHCGHLVSRVYERKFEVVQGQYWLTDGDTNPYLYGLLKEFPPRGFAEETLFGSQPCCNGKYFVVEACLVNADILEYPETHFFEEPLQSIEARNYIAESSDFKPFIPSQWVVTQAPSPNGIIQRHLFGPFKRSEHCDDYWDYSCLLLLRLWDDLWELIGVPQHCWALLASNAEGQFESWLKTATADPQEAIATFEREHPGAKVLKTLAVDRDAVGRSVFLRAPAS
jgi:hypothetical protein